MSNDPFTRTIDFQQLCTEIAEHLAELDGEALADLANKVLSDRVTYDGDSVFTVEDADAEGLRSGITRSDKE
jgi:hypothetical protein